MWTTDEHGWYLADEATMNWPGMVVGCRGPRRQGRTSSSDYVTPVTAAPCGCTLDCLQPITHRSSRDSCHFPFLRVRKRVARLPIPLSPPRTPSLESTPASAAIPPPRPPRAARVQGGGTTASNLERRTTTPGVSFPTQAATGQPQPSLSLENPRPVTRAARADVAKGERVQLFLPFFFLLLLVLFSLSLSFSLFTCESSIVVRRTRYSLFTNGEPTGQRRALSLNR